MLREHPPADACVVSVCSVQGLETVSRLWVAGLSGSAVFAAHDGLEEELRDTCGANCSLSTLATCLAVRCQGRSNVPWPDSPLTCLLKVLSSTFVAMDSPQPLV
jgi:hypothetical protein